MEEIKKGIKLIAVYARVSTAKQEEEKTIETQLSAVREFAKENGYTIVKEYIDDGWSGDILVRPQLDQLRQDAKNKIWEAVLAYDPDRLARRYSYQELVMDELREAGTEVLFVTTPVPRNGEERILQGVKGLFAEYERAKIAERFRLGKLRVVKEGHVLGSVAPYGYRYVRRHDREHGYYEVNKNEARVVKNIFSWAAYEGLTIRGIVKRLYEQNIRPRNSGRGTWTTGTLCRLLRNESYMGDAYYGKTRPVVPEHPMKMDKYRKTKKSSSRVRPRSEWIKIPVPPIIERDLFEQAQKRLKANFTFSRRHRKYSYLLAGKIWCSCGYRRNGNAIRKGKLKYYVCTQGLHTFPRPSACHEKAVNGTLADELVWQKLSSLMSSPRLLADQIKQWVARRNVKKRRSSTEIHVVVQEISRLGAEEERYMKAYGAGFLSLEKLDEYTKPVRNRITSLKGALVKAAAEKKESEELALPRQNEIQTFAKLAAEHLGELDFAAKQVIIRNVVDRIVATQSELHVYGFIPVSSSNSAPLCCSHGYNKPVLQTNSVLGCNGDIASCFDQIWKRPGSMVW